MKYSTTFSGFNRSSRGPTLFAGATFLALSLANADVIITLTEVGNDVVAEASGTLELPTTTPAAMSNFASNFANFGSGSGNTHSIQPFGTAGSSFDIYSFSASLTGDLTGTNQSDTTPIIGDLFLNISLDRIVVPMGFVSGGAMNGTSVIAGGSFSDYGIAPNQASIFTFQTASGNETVTFRTRGMSSIPEPSASLLFGALLGASCLFSRRRR